MWKTDQQFSKTAKNGFAKNYLKMNLNKLQSLPPNCYVLRFLVKFSKKNFN